MLAALGSVVQKPVAKRSSCFYEEANIGSQGSLCFPVNHAGKFLKVK